MSKGKSIFVTALVAVMLAAIIAGLYLLKYSRPFMVIIGIMGLYGYICAVFQFCMWLGQGGKDTALLPPAHHVKADTGGDSSLDELWTPGPDWNARYDEIKADLESEGGHEGERGR